MPDPLASDAEFARAQRAVERGWITKEQLEAVLVACEREPGRPLLDRLPLTLEQRRELESSDGAAETILQGGRARERSGVPPEVADAMKDPKRRIGRFVLINLLGKGGMGMVFRGWEPELRQWVALKFLRQIGDDTARAYFKREAQLAAGLDHPNIAKIYEIGEHEGQPFIAMQFVDGESLSSAKKRMNLEAKIDAVTKIAEAVKFAHQKKVIHRDLKPANVMIDQHGQVYVMDFGLAKESAVEGASIGGSSLVVGTPSYMAPEQAKGKADRQSDVYGIGAILYELVTGRPPFTGESSTDVIDQVIHQEPIWPRKVSPTIPEDVEAIILHALEKEPKRRYGDAAELIGDLNSFSQKNPLKSARRPTLGYVLGKKIRKQPLLWTFAALMVMAILGGATFGTTQLLRARREALRAEGEARHAQAEAEDKASVEVAGRIAAERERRNAEFQGWNASLEAARGWYEKSFAAGADGCDQAAMACLLRALEVAPRERVPAEFPTNGGESPWAEEAWLRFRYLDAWTPKVARRFAAGDEEITCAALSADGKVAVSGDRMGSVKVWDADSGERLREWWTERGSVSTVGVSGDIVAGGWGDGTVIAIDFRTGQEIKRFERANVFENSVCVSAAEQTRLVELGTWREMGTVRGNVRAISRDGKFSISATADGGVRTWDAATGKELSRLAQDAREYEDFALSSDGKWALGGSYDGSIQAWNTVTGEKTIRLKGHTGPVRSVRFGARILSASDDKTVRVWNRKTGNGIWVLQGFEHGVSVVAADDSGRRALTGTIDGVLWLWELPEFAEIAGGPGNPPVWALSPDRSLALVEGGEQLEIHGARDGSIVCALKGRCRGFRQLAWSGDGQRVAANTIDGVLVWDAATGSERNRFDIGSNAATRLAMNRDGSALAAALQASATRNTVVVWDVKTGRERSSLEGHGTQISALTFDREGRRFASGDWDGTVFVWDVAAGRMRHRLEASRPSETEAIDELTFGPSGEVLIAAGSNGTVTAWDTETGRALRRFKCHNMMTGRPAFGGDGRVLAVVSDRDIISLWDVRAAREIRRLPAKAQTVWQLAWMPGEAGLLVVFTDGTTREVALVDPRTPTKPPESRSEFDALLSKIALGVVREGPDKGAIRPAERSDDAKKIDPLAIGLLHLDDSAVHCDDAQKGRLCRENSHWRTRMLGHDFSAAPRVQLEIGRRARLAQSNERISELEVFIRGEPFVPWGLVQSRMMMCAQAGIYKIEWHPLRAGGMKAIEEARGTGTDERIKVWLPNKVIYERDPGEIRVFIRVDSKSGALLRRVGRRPTVEDDAKLVEDIRAEKAEFDAKKQDVPVRIDAAPEVPWLEVIRTLQTCRRSNFERIEFAAPPPQPFRTDK